MCVCGRDLAIVSTPVRAAIEKRAEDIAAGKKVPPNCLDIFAAWKVTKLCCKTKLMTGRDTSQYVS